jgi:hypothetical protein
MSEVPTQGVFDFVSPGEDIVLHRGDGVVDGAVGRVELWVSTGRIFGPRWRLEAGSRDVKLDSSILSIEHPHLGEVEVSIAVRGTRSGTEGPIALGSVGSSHLGGAAQLDRVIVHWMNLPMILPSSGLRVGDTSWSGRWDFEAAGWSFRLDSRSDLSEVLRIAHDQEQGFVMTHVGEIRRSDGEPFEAADVTEAIFAWQLTLSFALGRWVAPAIPVGLSQTGERVWEEWAPWRCDTIHGHDAWWDTHTADDLKLYATRFVEALLDSSEGPIVRHLAMHIIAANHGSTTAEGQVMLAIAGLEYLAWVDLVLNGGVSEERFSRKGAAWRIRKMLRGAQIPLQVPAELVGLYELAQQENLDGPAAVVHARHLIVHPKDPTKPYAIEGLVWQAAQLLMEYGELLLLQRLEYSGRFMRRYPPNRWAHSSEPVPWAANAPRD